MRFAVIGSRTYNNLEQLNRTLSFFIKNKGDVVVSGGAQGADLDAAKWARKRGFEVKEWEPDWDKYGKGAGYRRNVDIINDCDMVIAFWGPDKKHKYSKGTEHSIGLAKDKKKPTFIVYF